MSAREMFEELGYELFISHLYPQTAKNYQIVYQNEENNPRRIEFRKNKLDGGCLYISHRELIVGVYDDRISLNIIKAINKQIEELGWNND